MEHAYSRLLVVFSVLALCLLGSQGVRCELTSDFYDETCPDLYTIVQRHVFAAMRAEMRMGASLLRLHFHDCFVNVTVLTS
jgi:peroxidase